MKTLTLLCGLLALAACAGTPNPAPSPSGTSKPVPCDQGGPCGPNERPR